MDCKRRTWEDIHVPTILTLSLTSLHEKARAQQPLCRGIAAFIWD